MKLTVYYDDSFWVGVVEERIDQELRAAKIVFGPEPQDAEILWFVNHGLLSLLAAAKPLANKSRLKEKSFSPKRRAREAAKEIQKKGISTYAQEALKEDLKSRKKAKKLQRKYTSEKSVEKKRELAVLKAKAKHRGK